MHPNATNKTPNNYYRFYFSNILKFSANRLLPYIGMALTGILIAHKNFEEFSFFSYLSSAYLFPATIATFTFFAIGNVSPEHGHNQKAIFNSAFAMAVALALLCSIACVVIFLLSQEEIHSYPPYYKAMDLAQWYILYIFLYIINSFFSSFYEAWVKDRTSTIGRAVGFVPLISIAVLWFFTTSPENYSYNVILLMTGSALLELVFYLIVSLHKNLFRFTYHSDIMRRILAIGMPLGLGLAAQRLAFFLVNKRLLLTDKDTVSVFAVAISVTSLLSIPIAALSQIHSIHATRNPKSIPVNALAYILVLTLLPSTLLTGGFDHELLSLYGLRDQLLDTDPLISAALLAILLSTAPLMLVTAHLRARGRSVVSQVVINVFVYGIYLTAVYSGFLDNSPPSYLLFAYALTFLASCAVLIGYCLYTK